MVEENFVLIFIKISQNDIRKEKEVQNGVCYKKYKLNWIFVISSYVTLNFKIVLDHATDRKYFIFQ